MSPTVKSASLPACARHNAQTAQRRPGRREPSCFTHKYFLSRARRAVGFKICSTELACDVVEQCDTHQQDEQRNTNLLSERLGALRERAALQPLHELKDDL